MITAAKISTFFQTSKLFRIIVRMMSDFLYFCTEIERKNNCHEDIVSRTD